MEQKKTEQPKAEQGKTLREDKPTLTQMRRYSSTFYYNSPLLTDFEKTYGKYLFVPFDIPVIKPNDMEKFVRFYFTNAKMVSKVISDLLSTDFNAGDKSPYLSITSVAEDNSDVWAPNKVPAIYTEFPEIFEQIHEYMPFVTNRDFKWTMWSSNWDVPEHRDYGSMIDAPVGVRIKLFDTNPYETLSLKQDPLDFHKEYDWYSLPIPPDTNSFAWNNLRQKHKSVFVRGNRKILMIFSAKDLHKMITGPNLNHYVDLLDRSIAKYKNSTVVDTETKCSDYLTIQESDPVKVVLNGNSS